MMIIKKKPFSLLHGDKIGVVAPSFFIEKYDNFVKGINTLNELGFVVSIADSVTRKFENTTLDAYDRAEEINSFFKDDEIKAIICADGGCRAIELLDYLDYSLIADHPKIFCGFSDITHLLLAIYSKSKIPAVHGIDIINGFGSDNVHRQRNIANFMQLVSGDTSDIYFSDEWDVVLEGEANGILIGGWLEAILNLSNSQYLSLEQDERIILFWETINLEPSRIAMYLHALEKASWFPKVSAVLVGKLKGCEEKEYWDCAPNMMTVLKRIGLRNNIPVVANLGFGHGDELTSFPLGINALINTSNHKIQLLDNLTKKRMNDVSY